ncbi:MAG: Txe/YoeB family addiction module toxin [Burkholderiales bacterium]
MPGAGAPPRKRQVRWTRQALADLAHWDRSDRRVASRVRQLVSQIEQQPFAGIGKPEPLRYEWSGYWSRRITREHRLVYRVEGDSVYIAQCRFHYD